MQVIDFDRNITGIEISTIKTSPFNFIQKK